MTDMIEVLANMSGPEWQRITNAMKYARVWPEFTQERVPEILRPLESVEQWLLIHKEVTKLRRAAYRAKQDQLNAGRIEKRREYMRRYMSAYRKRS